MSDLAHTAFFGDGEHKFLLTPALIVELEEKCGAIGMVCHRVFNKQFAQADISEVIRLALIGGGMTPKRAAELISAYVAGRPFTETWPLASKTLDRLWFAAPIHEEKK